MIRRAVGTDWLMITQVDHARLAGEMAARVGNQLFDQPRQRDLFVRAVAMHDDGWTEIDHHPPCNAAGEPLDFTDAPIALSLQAWGISAEQAVGVDPLIGLLVSLHSLTLSINRSAADAAALSDATTRFALNKFQHRQIELQEHCRKQLNLASDQPLRHGLAESSADPREQSIVHQFRLLQALDELSLSLCCTLPMGTQIKPVLARPGGRSITLRAQRLASTVLRVSPWPMESSPLRFSVNAARLNQPPRVLELTLTASR